MFGSIFVGIWHFYIVIHTTSLSEGFLASSYNSIIVPSLNFLQVLLLANNKEIFSVFHLFIILPILQLL